jgi:site-specific DNA-methyltransferase (adenine-specific)
MASDADAAEHRYNCEGGYKRQKNWHLDDMTKGTLAGGWKQPQGEPPTVSGRWPANFALLDEQAAAALDRQSGERPSGTWNKTAGMRPFNNNGEDTGYETIDGIRDSGGASRFFFRVTERLDQADPVMYCAKASRAEREAGLERLPVMAEGIGDERPSGQSMQRFDGRDERKRANVHPTVKPLQLTRWLATLLLPPPEYFPRRIVIPFAGVMSEGIGASQAGWDEIVGVEREAEYVEIGRARYEHWCKSATTKQLELAEAV